MASEMQKPSPSKLPESSEKARKSDKECHDNSVITTTTGKILARKILARRGDSNELCRIPQKGKDAESEVSAIDKLADIAKDKIQKLTLENIELKHNLVSFPNKVLTNLRNGLTGLYNSLLNMETFTEQTMGLQDTLRANENEAEEMISKVKFIASILHSSTPICIPIMNEYEVNACEGILRNISASTTTLKTRVEHIKQTLDGCTGKLEKQAEYCCIPSLKNSDGKCISLAEFNEVVDSFMAKFESTVQIFESSERLRNEQVMDLVMFATARVERSALLRELIQETIQPLLKELKETKERVGRRFIINTLQIEEDYLSCKKAVDEKLPAK